MRSSPRLTSAWRSKNYWPAAIQLAGLDQEPPLSCTLLMAAMRAFREGEYRTCVAHAGAAAEVALGEALRRIRKPLGIKTRWGPLPRTLVRRFMVWFQRCSNVAWSMFETE